MISACVGFSTASKKVQGQYEALLERLGAEFTILREVPPEDIRKAGGEVLAEGMPAAPCRRSGAETGI